MRFRIPSAPRFFVSALVVISLSAVTACRDSGSGPTAPSTGTLSGTVIRGSSTLGMHALGVEIGLSGVTVRVTSNGKSTQTDSAGNFTLGGVPTGQVELTFERSDIHARGSVHVSGSSTTVTISIVGSTAVAVGVGHAGEEIEGLVQNVGAAALTVLDQRLGAVVVSTDGSTVIRRGGTGISLSQIQIGMRVHVKALRQQDSTYLATEVLLQDENIGANRQVSGPVQSISTQTKSFVVSSGGVLVPIQTDTSTTFQRWGGSATFTDLSIGTVVDVNGTLQADGTVLARKVTIAG